MPVWRARAKLNLYLRVCARREDGYHELVTLFDRLELADEIQVRLQDTPGVELEVEGDAPADASNLAWRAAAAVLEAAASSQGVHVVVRKRVPAAAGLGGGSSDAATVLQRVNGLLGDPVSPDRLERIATGLGADVPFFLGGRMAWGRGVGEVLKPVSDPPPLHYVLLHPGFAVSTAAAFAAWDAAASGPEASAGADTSLESVTSIDFMALAGGLRNDLQAVIAAQHPEIEAMRSALLDAGAAAAQMSGSGPTVFGLFEGDAAARDAYDVLVGSGRFQAILTRGD